MQMNDLKKSRDLEREGLSTFLLKWMHKHFGIQKPF